MFIKKVFIPLLLSFTLISGYLGVSSALKKFYGVHYTNIYISIEENLSTLDIAVVDEKISDKEKKLLLDMVNLYFLTRECMEYYNIDDIHKYMKLQTKIPSVLKIRNNYHLYKYFKGKDRELQSAFSHLE